MVPGGRPPVRALLRLEETTDANESDAAHHEDEYGASEIFFKFKSRKFCKLFIHWTIHVYLEIADRHNSTLI
jgi:hypothetical protein